MSNNFNLWLYASVQFIVISITQFGKEIVFLYNAEHNMVSEIVSFIY